MAAERRTPDWLAEPVQRIGQDAKSPIYILAATQTRLADVATGEVVASPNDIARLGFAVAVAAVLKVMQFLVWMMMQSICSNYCRYLESGEKPFDHFRYMSLQDPPSWKLLHKLRKTSVKMLVYIDGS